MRKKQIGIGDVSAGMPGDHEQGEGHDDTENFGQTVEEQIIYPGGEKKADQSEDENKIRSQALVFKFGSMLVLDAHCYVRLYLIRWVWDISSAPAMQTSRSLRIPFSML